MSKNEARILVITDNTVGFATEKENEAAKALAHQMFCFVDLIHDLIPELHRHEAISLTIALLKGISAGAFDDPQAIAELKRAAENIIKSRGE